MSFGVKDKDLIQTAALPNGAAATQITGFDLGHDASKLGRVLADFEIEIASPALTTGELPDGQTITYSVEVDDAIAFGSAVKIADVFTVTGAGGVGAAAVTKRFRLPTDAERAVRVKATKTGAANASTKSMTVALTF